jgi:predicted ATPase
MGIGILVMGESGTGKSTSIRNLTGAGIINVYGKPLPFKTDMKTVQEDNCEKIIKILRSCKSNIIVIDDFQGLLVSQFMDRAKETGYQKFTDMALGYYKVIKTVSEIPLDKRVYFLSHIERDQQGNEKVKTIGKLLDEKVTVEGLFTIVLKTVVRDGKYFFQTHNSGSDTVKSPLGMFEEDLIPNDLLEVDRVVKEYYAIGGKAA